ncbi:MAG: hypothetical protein KAV87_01705 [Desulfobacteraceae bacterium]|nr:hypothetical protein [Desulfobacteraceae bacterium]
MWKDKLHQADADEIRSAVVEELKENPGNPAPAPEVDTTKEELAALSAKVAELENGSKQDGNALSKVLAGFSDAIGELKGTIEGLLTANSGLEEKVTTLEEAKSNPEAEAILNGRIEELENWKADKLAEEEAAKAEEAVDEDDRCPECKANVGFKDLEIQKEYGGKHDIIKYLFGKELNGKDADGREVIGEFRECPRCGYREPATEEAAISEV